MIVRFYVMFSYTHIHTPKHTHSQMRRFISNTHHTYIQAYAQTAHTHTAHIHTHNNMYCFIQNAHITHTHTSTHTHTYLPLHVEISIYAQGTGQFKLRRLPAVKRTSSGLVPYKIFILILISLFDRMRFKLL